MADPLSEAAIHRIVEILVGTCGDENAALAFVLERDPVDEEVDDMLAALDDHCFRCDCCDWWSGVDELADTEGGMVCEECAAELED